MSHDFYSKVKVLEAWVLLLFNRISTDIWSKLYQFGQTIGSVKWKEAFGFQTSIGRKQARSLLSGNDELVPMEQERWLKGKVKSSEPKVRENNPSRAGLGTNKLLAHVSL